MFAHFLLHSDKSVRAKDFLNYDWIYKQTQIYNLYIDIVELNNFNNVFVYNLVRFDPIIY